MSADTLARWLFLAGPALFLLVMLPHHGVVSPDAVEMAAAGKCIWQLPLVEGACDGREPWFWPPAFVMLAGLPVLLGMDPAVAALSMALLCWAVLMWPAGLLAQRLAPTGGAWAAALVVPVLLVVPGVPFEILMSDARCLSLLTTFTAALLALQAPSRGRLVAIGVLLGMACLSRPEAVLPAAALVGVVTLSARSLVPGLTCATLVLPYIAVLSAQAGQLALTSRSWQKNVNMWLTVLPDEWVKHELAAGAWGSPLRAHISTTPMTAAAPPTTDPGMITAWLNVVFLETLPWLLYALALAGLVLMLRARAWRALLLLGAAGLPCLVIMLMPQAQDYQLPLNNLQPLLVLLVLLAAVALGGLLAKLSARWSPAGWAGGLLAVALLAVAARPAPVDLSTPLSFSAAISWLKSETTADTSVTASLVTAAIPLRADRQRHHLPAPWSIPAWSRSAARTDLLIVSSWDLPGSLRSLRTLKDTVPLQPLVEFSDANSWVIIFSLEERAGSRRE